MSFVDSVLAVFGGRKKRTNQRPTRRPLLSNIRTDISESSPTGIQSANTISASSAATIRPQNRTRSPPTYGATQSGQHPAGPSMSFSPSPDRHRLSVSNDLGTLNRVPEEVTMEFQENGQRSRPTPPRHLSLSDDEGGGGDGEEDSDIELEEELALEEQGYYKGSYKRLILLYSFVPVTAVLSLVLLALLPFILYLHHRDHIPPSPYPYAPYFPFPIPETLTSAALWSLGYFLRAPCYSLIASLFSWSAYLSDSAIPLIFATILQTFLALIPLLTLPFLLIPYHLQQAHRPNLHDPAFARVWAVALGWAVAEATVGIKQGYDALALYQEVLIPPSDDGKSLGRYEDGATGAGAYGKSRFSRAVDGNIEPETNPAARSSLSVDGSASVSSFADHPPPRHSDSPEGENEPLLPVSWRARQELQLSMEDSLHLQLDHDLDQLVALKLREELEELYGMPIIRIPVFVACLQRLNSILLALGFTLLLSAAYIRSSLSSYPPPSLPFISIDNASYSYLMVSAQKPNNRLPIFSLFTVLTLQFLLSILHTPLLLPKIGVHTVVYVGSIVSLGAFFAGLASWDVLS